MITKCRVMVVISQGLRYNKHNETKAEAGRIQYG